MLCTCTSRVQTNILSFHTDIYLKSLIWCLLWHSLSQTALSSLHCEEVLYYYGGVIIIVITSSPPPSYRPIFITQHQPHRYPKTTRNLTLQSLECSLNNTLLTRFPPACNLLFSKDVHSMAFTSVHSTLICQLKLP